MNKHIFDITPAPKKSVRKRRVAAYARVSCGKDAMLHSLAAQIDYYRDFIRNDPDWDFAGVYADEAKTGTKEDREQFQRLLADCRGGAIDMVVTKSISRFARNTVTLLETVRELKALGVEVWFFRCNHSHHRLPGKPSAVPFPGRSHRGVPLAGSLPPGKLDGGNAGNGAAESIGWEVNSMAEKKVRKIEATAPLHRAQAFTPVKKRRVAAYARVSTDKDEQQNSYEAQVDYYTTHIQGNPEWIFAGVYSDAGITGTSMKKRDGFNQMVADALAGKIDLILTKSVSRFARNTVDSLTTVRKLKEKGVEVYFEKENIYTLDSKGELLITIMSSLLYTRELRSLGIDVYFEKERLHSCSAEGELMLTLMAALAESEAENMSENIKWGKRRRYEKGRVESLALA